MGKVLGALAMIVVFGVVGYGLYVGYGLLTAHQHQAQASANVAVVAGTSQAQTAEGHEAVEAVQAAGVDEAASKALTQKNTAAIEAAPGAETPEPPDLYNASLRALCQRRIYQADPRCVQLRHRGS